MGRREVSNLWCIPQKDWQGEAIGDGHEFDWKGSDQGKVMYQLWCGWESGGDGRREMSDLSDVLQENRQGEIIGADLKEKVRWGGIVVSI